MKTFVVENGVQATEKINHLEVEGFVKDDIYLFAHDPNLSLPEQILKVSVFPSKASFHQ